MAWPVMSLKHWLQSNSDLNDILMETPALVADNGVGYTVAIDTPSGPGNFVNMGQQLGVNQVTIEVPDGGDRFRVSGYGGVDATFDDFKAEKVDAVEPPVSGLIPVTADQLWNDMHGEQQYYPSATAASFDMFKGPWQRDVQDYSDWNYLNVWAEVELQGDGSHCSEHIDNCLYTFVEMGELRSWYLDANDNTWYEMSSAAIPGGIAVLPNMGGGLFNERRGCSDEDYPAIYNDRVAHWSNIQQTLDRGLSGDNHQMTKPDWHYRAHPFTGTRKYFADRTIVKATYGLCYFRLKQDGSINDFDDSRFIVHMGSDMYASASGGYLRGTGMGRYKRVSSDWQAAIMMTGNLTRAELDNSINLPLPTTP